jgi:curved DNA-binding protein CbpA
MYHPDVCSDPEAEDLMKSINIAYTVLREKFRREAALRERQPYTRQTRRYYSAESRSNGAGAYKSTDESEKEAHAALYGYFRALCSCDYSAAYNHLSGYDKKHITRESFIEWRESVARLFNMKEFSIVGNSTGATVTFNGGRTVFARKFSVIVAEEDLTENTTRSSDVEKLVISEHGMWSVFLGYKGLGDLTRAFDEQFEAGRKRDIAKRWEEYYTGLCPDFNMLSLTGMRKAVSRELYRQKRFGGTLTFAAISISDGSGEGENGQKEQLLRMAAKTIRDALRETDIPAYAGDGVFAILFVELRRKNAEEIIVRLTKKIRGNAGPKLGMAADIEYAFQSWTSSSSVGVDALNAVLARFRKKL